MFPNGNSPAPTNLDRVQVTVSERVATFFARVVGQSELPVNSNGVACFGDCRLWRLSVGGAHYPATAGGSTPGHTVFLPNGTQLSSTDPRYGKWGSAMQGMTIRFPSQTGSDFIQGSMFPG